MRRTVFVVSSAKVYSVPPLKSNQGHKAKDWDVENPIWTGRVLLEEYEDDTDTGSLKCELRLEDPTSGELFASAPYSASGQGIDPVTDSSRFFAIRVVDGTRSATLGLGFEDRAQAFELNVALQDFRKHSQPVAQPAPKKDFSLRPGTQIRLKLGTKGDDMSETSDNSEKDQNNDSAFVIPGLPPPPKRQDFDDDFGDFHS